MATFRFSVEIGTDDDQVDPAVAESRIRALREWLMQAPVRDLGTLFVSDVEINPTAVSDPHPVMVTQAGFGLLKPENVAKALFTVWGYCPKVESITPASNGVWLVPVPLNILASEQYEWIGPDSIRVMVSS
jgi:hypothetical protein